MEQYSATKENRIVSFAVTQVEGITLSEISQTEKDKYYMISLVCDLKNKTSEYNNNKKKLTDTENKPVVIGEREGGSKIGVGD